MAAAIVCVGLFVGCTPPAFPVMPNATGLPAVTVAKDTMVQAGTAVELLPLPQGSLMLATPISEDEEQWVDFGVSGGLFHGAGNVGYWKRLTPMSEGRRSHWAFRAGLGGGLGDLLGVTSFGLAYGSGSATFQYVRGSIKSSKGDFFTVNMGLEGAIAINPGRFNDDQEVINIITPAFEFRGDFGVYKGFGGYIGLKLYALGILFSDSEVGMIPIYPIINGGFLF